MEVAEILCPPAPNTRCQGLLRPFPSLGVPLCSERRGHLCCPTAPLHPLCLVLSKGSVCSLPWAACALGPHPTMQSLAMGRPRGDVGVPGQTLKYQKGESFTVVLIYLFIYYVYSVLKRSPNVTIGLDIHAECQPFFLSKPKCFSKETVASVASLASPGGCRELRAICWAPPVVPAPQLREHRSQTCPLPQGSPGGCRKFGAVHWTSPIVLAQQLRGCQFQSFSFLPSSAKKR